MSRLSGNSESGACPINWGAGLPPSQAEMVINEVTLVAGLADRVAVALPASCRPSAAWTVAQSRRQCSWCSGAGGGRWAEERSMSTTASYARGAHHCWSPTTSPGTRWPAGSSVRKTVTPSYVPSTASRCRSSLSSSPSRTNDAGAKGCPMLSGTTSPTSVCPLRSRTNTTSTSGGDHLVTPRCSHRRPCPRLVAPSA